MDWPTIAVDSLWAGLFAGALGFLLTAPARYLLPTLLCGFAGRFLRDVLVGGGLALSGATAVSAAVLVLLAVCVDHRKRISPVVLICAALPLGAAVAVFNMIFDFLKVSALQDEALEEASVALVANAGQAFAGTLSVALGLGAGVALVRLFKREQAEGV